MKLKLLCITLLSFTFFVNAQNYRLTVGNEMKLKKGTSDLNIVAVDNSGLYIVEKRITEKFSFDGNYNVETRLIKVDQNYKEIFAKDYDKELEDYSFHSFQKIGDDLFIIADSYLKKEKAFKVFAAKIDNATGNLVASFKELASSTLEDKKDQVRLQAEVVDNNKMLLVTRIAIGDNIKLVIEVFNDKLLKEQTSVINLAWTPKTYMLQDIKLVANNQILLLGNEMQEVSDGKNSTKTIFKQFRVSLYDVKGVKLKDISIDAGSRFMVNGLLSLQPNSEMLLTGFYSNNATKSQINGFFTSSINTDKGELTSTVFKEILKPTTGNADTSLKAKQFGNQFIIRTIDENPTKDSYIITAEAFDYTRYERSEQERMGTNTITNYYTWHRFTNSDLLVINAKKSGEIDWLTMIPKVQIEEFRSTGSSVPFGTGYSDFFAQGGGMPYYSSYKTMLRKNQLILFFNDNSDNLEHNPMSAKPVSDFKGKSNLYAVSIDVKSGKMNRKMVTANGDELLLMPRHSYITGSDILIPSMKGRILGKTILKIATVTVK